MKKSSDKKFKERVRKKIINGWKQAKDKYREKIEVLYFVVAGYSKEIILPNDDTATYNDNWCVVLSDAPMLRLFQKTIYCMLRMTSKLN